MDKHSVFYLLIIYRSVHVVRCWIEVWLETASVWGSIFPNPSFGSGHGDQSCFHELLLIPSCLNQSSHKAAEGAWQYISLALAAKWGWTEVVFASSWLLHRLP